MGDQDHPDPLVVRTDFLDYPTAWAIQKQCRLTHVPKCSAAQTDGMFLCDCGSVEAEWHRLAAQQGGAT